MLAAQAYSFPALAEPSTPGAWYVPVRLPVQEAVGFFGRDAADVGSDPGLTSEGEVVVADARGAEATEPVTVEGPALVEDMADFASSFTGSALAGGAGDFGLGGALELGASVGGDPGSPTADRATPSAPADPSAPVKALAAPISSLQAAAGVPEPAAWMLMLSGFACMGALLRAVRPNRPQGSPSPKPAYG